MKNYILISMLALVVAVAPVTSLQAQEKHEAHKQEEDEHGKTAITPDQAKAAGVEVATAQAGTIAGELTLTGRIILNRDTTAIVKARFPGIVRDVPVTLGQRVEKGQILARIESNESLRDYNVTAPVAGVVLTRNTNTGDVADGEALFTIADLSTVWAKFHIFPKDTDDIGAGQSVRVHTLDNKMEAKAPIKLFLPTADALSQTHIAIVVLDNENHKWRAGMTVEGDAIIAETRASVAVPQSAIQTMEGRQVVFVMKDNHYEARPVQTGRRDSRQVEILSGLQAGTQYVSRGSFVIKADLLKSGAAHSH